MKNRIFVLGLFLINLFTSCNPESFESDSNPIDEYHSFLQAYYKDSYTIGNSITIDSEGIDILEILGGNSETPIGYVAVDKQDRNPLYFLDMNVAKDEMTAIDFTNDNSKSCSFRLKTGLVKQRI